MLYKVYRRENLGNFLIALFRGLDSSSCTKCFLLLKKLASKGKTIICTIHQPSALLLQMFDKIYVLTDGKCLYDGTPSNLLPHLSSFGLVCPTYHNPADFCKYIFIQYTLYILWFFFQFGISFLTTYKRTFVCKFFLCNVNNNSWPNYKTISIITVFATCLIIKRFYCLFLNFFFQLMRCR